MYDSKVPRNFEPPNFFELTHWAPDWHIKACSNIALNSQQFFVNNRKFEVLFCDVIDTADYSRCLMQREVNGSKLPYIHTAHSFYFFLADLSLLFLLARCIKNSVNKQIIFWFCAVNCFGRKLLCGIETICKNIF